MSRNIDRDLRVLKKLVEWMEKSTSERMKKANAEYIYDRYVRHPSSESESRDAE